MFIRTASEIKKLLTSEGWMVYRSMEDAVLLAERVRDNLIMEAYVSVEVGDAVRVRFATRAQRSDFPSSSETEDTLLKRARAMAHPALSLGFVEQRTLVEPIPDPMDPARHLDTWYQVIFEKSVDSNEALLRAVSEAMGLEKVAPR